LCREYEGYPVEIPRRKTTNPIEEFSSFLENLVANAGIMKDIRLDPPPSTFSVHYSIRHRAGVYQVGSLELPCGITSGIHGMELPQAALGSNGLQIWRIAANVLN
jgi:hypothetical protein